MANRYTNPSRLAIRGASNGGLLMGATFTQRPDLFQAMMCEFPDVDMVGYHRFENNNPPALLEYGNAALPEQLKFFYAYSPYQKVKPGTKYAAVLFTTGDADTRVPPLQAPGGGSIPTRFSHFAQVAQHVSDRGLVHCP